MMHVKVHQNLLRFLKCIQPHLNPLLPWLTYPLLKTIIVATQTQRSILLKIVGASLTALLTGLVGVTLCDVTSCDVNGSRVDVPLGVAVDVPGDGST